MAVSFANDSVKVSQEEYGHFINGRWEQGASGKTITQFNPATSGVANGLFIQPTILDDVRYDMRVAQEEIFGPVTSVITWDDEAEMIRQANGTRYGLDGGVWTRDLTQAHEIATALDTGVVWVNRYYNLPIGIPVGGYKQSGFGREMALDTLNHYTITKSVIINLKEGPLGIFDT
jgi:aldehyde dehydrogenase